MKNIIVSTVFLTTIFLSACTSTRITSSWREPNKTVVVDKLTKVLVVALFKDETSRHKAEDQMAGYLKGKGIVSYNYLDPSFNEANKELLRKKIKDDGFDGAVTMRLVDVDKEKVFMPVGRIFTPNYNRDFSDYYLRSWSYFSSPNYYATTKTYIIETNVFSIKENKIIWTGLTETTDPDGVKKMTEEVASAVFKQMVKEGFVSKK